MFSEDINIFENHATSYMTYERKQKKQKQTILEETKLLINILDLELNSLSEKANNKIILLKKLFNQIE